MRSFIVGDMYDSSNTITQHHDISALRKLAGQKRKIRKRKKPNKNSLRRTLHQKIVEQSKPIDNIVNLAGITLSNAQTSVLNKGLSFVQTPRKTEFKKVEQSFTEFKRKMQTHYFFTTQPDLNRKNTTFRTKSAWYPPEVDYKPLVEYFSAVHRDLIQLHNNSKNNNENLSQSEKEAIFQLKSMKNIIFRKADKGGKLTILTADSYLAEAYRQLNDTKYYRETSHDHTAETASQIETFLTHLHNKKLITFETFEFLEPSKNVRTPVFYILPKLHKEGIPGRPIVSGCNSPTEKLSRYLDFYLKPIVHKIPSYIKDTTHFLQVVLDQKDIPNDMILVTLDVKSLYTNIPHNEGINSCLTAIQSHYQGNTPLPIGHLRQMLIFILQNNHFTFNGKTYLQIHGTSMGTPFAPNYANIFMAEIEKKILENPPQNKRPTLWKRFIDDIFMIWPHGRTALHQFLEYINCLHETIKFTAQQSEKEISFLDTTIYVNKQRQLESNLFVKTTDICTLLHKESFHPNNCKKSMIFSQALRYRRVITADENLKLNLDKLRSNLIRRGYTIREINTQFDKVSKLSQREILFKPPNSKKTENILPFVIPYDENKIRINHILKRHWSLITQDEKLNKIWPKKPFLALQRHKNLADLLVHTSLAPQQTTDS